MQFFSCFVICGFLAVNVQSVKDNSSQQSCTVGRICGVLENVVRKQHSLEKKVEEHSKKLGGKSCNDGKCSKSYFLPPVHKKQPRFPRLPTI